MKELFNIPNTITLSRLLGIPIILYLLEDSSGLPSDQYRWWSVGIFLAVALTDWLDGYLARKLNQVSDIGKFLDPLVDKLLVLIVFLALIEMQLISAWGVGLILAREMAIAGWRVNQPKVSGANIWGKLKTVSQIVAIALLIAPLSPNFYMFAISIFWLSVGLTIVSGLIYVWPNKSA
ncbi:MAG: CDP-diacylglycerol--glycerol-3-phosphate 3-phosphatidyltransferase [Cyanobacteria bacterium P01_F01_bin.150]